MGAGSGWIESPHAAAVPPSRPTAMISRAEIVVADMESVPRRLEAACIGGLRGDMAWRNIPAPSE